MTQHTPSDPKIRAEIVAALYAAAEAALDPVHKPGDGNSRSPQVAQIVNLEAYRTSRTPVQIIDQSSIVFWDDLDCSAQRRFTDDDPETFRMVETNVVAFRRA